MICVDVPDGAQAQRIMSDSNDILSVPNCEASDLPLPPPVERQPAFLFPDPRKDFYRAAKLVKKSKHLKSKTNK